ncbi:MAG: choice-of-anchor I family protein [Acidobacteriota bacterium]
MRRWSSVGIFAIFLCLVPIAAEAQRGVELRLIGRFETGIFDDSGAEIPAFDPSTSRLFFTNAADNVVHVLDITDPQNSTLLATIELAALGGGVNSVAVANGVLAVAIEADPAQAPGTVAFYDTQTLELLSSVAVGALPDMVTFTPDGTKVLTANEGEPVDYCMAGLDQDPVGSISIIDISGGAAAVTAANVMTAGFGAFDGAAPEGVRIFGPNATVSQDLEPEYIAVSPDSATAWVTLQENNAVAIVDIATGMVTDIVPLGVKDHHALRTGFDASNRDDTIRIRPWPTVGMYQPDAITAYERGGNVYYVTANEGDARDYDCFSEEERVNDLTLDPAVFPAADVLQRDENLGRLTVTTVNGDMGADGDFEEIWQFGARSFSIWNSAGERIYDSGNEFELITAGAFPDEFNSNNDENDSADARSDDKGPEPEGVVVGSFRGRDYAFIGLERVGGVMVYDVSEPQGSFFVDYISSRDFEGDAEMGEAGDLGPEGLVYIPIEDSPIPRALLVVTYEVSGSVAFYSLVPRG